MVAAAKHLVPEHSSCFCLLLQLVIKSAHIHSTLYSDLLDDKSAQVEIGHDISQRLPTVYLDRFTYERDRIGDY